MTFSVILLDFVLSTVTALQSMVITKQTHIGGKGLCLLRSALKSPIHKCVTVPEHNDSCVFHRVCPFRSGTLMTSNNSQYIFGQICILIPLLVFSPDTKSNLQYTNPPTALGFWIALEHCTAQNGALSFLPSSHNTALISKRFVRLPGGGTGFERLLSPEAEAKASEESKGEYLMVECAPGLLYHSCQQNK